MDLGGYWLGYFLIQNHHLARFPSYQSWFRGGY